MSNPAPVVIGPATLWQGDCLAVMPTLAADSLDAIVTDPPYGLSFMGKDWDHGIPGPAFWVEALRVAKPGAHLIAFGGSRTFHRLVCAIEDAGWEVRDVLMWVYGSGFPKSLDVSKALDKREGAKREVIGQKWADKYPNGPGGNSFSVHQSPDGSRTAGNTMETAPATDAARQWAGWGTALKPAYEPILLARKPLAGTVAGNVLAHGTGAINVDGCRIETDDGNPAWNYPKGPKERTGSGTWNDTNSGFKSIETEYKAPAAGRFPANFIHDGSPEVVALFPETTSGSHKEGAKITINGGKGYAGGVGAITLDRDYIGDSGSAARFFYTAKASKDDRDEGCAGFDAKPTTTYGDFAGTEDHAPKGDHNIRRNHHPTVKPTSLMRYLCRLVTPPDGLILDLFMGSGSTGKAALLEGFRFVGIEQDPEYLAIAAARVRAAHEQPKQMDLLADLPAPAPFKPRQAPIAQQTPLFEADA